jgi:hypothetical protein
MKQHEHSSQKQTSAFSRREFLTASGLTLLGIAAHGCATANSSAHPEPIIDIHQHVLQRPPR